MGTWNATCCLSRFDIREGDRVWFVPLRHANVSLKHVYDQLTLMEKRTRVAGSIPLVEFEHINFHVPVPGTWDGYRFVADNDAEMTAFLAYVRHYYIPRLNRFLNVDHYHKYSHKHGLGYQLVSQSALTTAAEVLSPVYATFITYYERLRKEDEREWKLITTDQSFVDDLQPFSYTHCWLNHPPYGVACWNGFDENERDFRHTSRLLLHYAMVSARQDWETIGRGSQDTSREFLIAYYAALGAKEQERIDMEREKYGD